MNTLEFFSKTREASVDDCFNIVHSTTSNPERTMRSTLNNWSTLLLSGFLLASAEAQTMTPPTSDTPSAVLRPKNDEVQAMQPSTSNIVAFHEPKRLESAPQPLPALTHISAQLSGKLIGQWPNASIQFVLILQNTGSQEVKILDPLDSLSLLFSTTSNRPIAVPKRIPKSLINVKSGKNSVAAKRDLPYPAPVQFRQIRRGSLAVYEKQDMITISPGDGIEVVFDCEPVVTERVRAALQSEPADSAKSFRAEAFLALISAPPKPGEVGESLSSDPVLFSIP